MGTPESDDIPTLQRLYDNVWLLALLAVVFFSLSYVGWGIIDIISVPVR